MEIRTLSRLEEINPENDNIDVHVQLDDGRIFSFLFATPPNITCCMNNEGIDYYFGTPPVSVRRLDRENIEKAINAVLTEDGGRWLELYGVLQDQ